MKNCSLTFILLLACSLFYTVGYGQLAFCSGDVGDPIFTEDFGTGTTNGPPLAPGITTYTYVNSGPEDGFYTISPNLQQLGSFHSGPDNTPNDQNGKALIVNASFTADEFYRRTITNLCENTSYEFSAFVLNVYDIDSGACPSTGIPVNVQFQIWDSTDTTLLASGDTGDINGTSNPIWEAYGLVFETGVAQTEVILKMINNGDGGCGNDLAIDDIVFRACGEVTQITSDISGADNLILCNSQSTISTTLTVTTAPGVFIQWQTSANGQNWTNITGATSDTFVASGLSSASFFRVNTATDIDNLGNVFCSFFSEPFLIDFIEGPASPQSGGDIVYCSNESIPAISVTSSQGVEVRWYETATSTEVLATGASFIPIEAGTYFAQAFAAGTDCGSTTRTPVTLTELAAPAFNNPLETLVICENQEVRVLSAQINNVSYAWSTGETTPSITINVGGVYTVTVTNTVGCTATKTFEVEGFESPVLTNIVSEGENIRIEVATDGVFEYSINGFSYTSSPVFSNVPGGLVTVFVRNLNGCLPTVQEFYHFNIPTFFTPNSDGINDFFLLPDAAFFESTFIRVFDRFGKLLTSGEGSSFRWDGTYRGKQLPPSDYWYTIEVDGRVVTGHISLLL